MYLSICKRDFNDFKTGELFDTYQKSNYVFISKKGTESKFISIPFQEYQSYFTYFKDHIFLPVQETVYSGFFRKKEIIQKKEVYIKLEGMDFEHLVAMQLPIIDVINKLSKIESFSNYTESIHTCLMEIENDIDITFNENKHTKQKINHLATLVKEAQNALEINFKSGVI